MESKGEVMERAATRSVIVYGFLMVITMLIAITSIGLNRIDTLTADLETVVKERDEQILLMHRMRQAARERSLTLQSMMIVKDPFSIDDYAIQMGEAAGLYIQSRENLLRHALTPPEQELLTRQHQQTIATGDSQNRIIQYLRNGDYLSAAETLFYTTLPGQRRAMGMMDEFIALKRQQNIDELARTRRDIDSTYGLMIVLSAIGVILSLLIAYYVSHRINSEMARRRLSENNLRESELRERTIRENIVDGVLTLDTSGTILSCNRACSELFACRGEEIVGRSAHILLPDTITGKRNIDLARHLKAWERRVLGTGHEFTGRRRDGSTFPAELDVSKAEMGGETVYIAVIRDISEKKAARQRLERFNTELEQRVTERTAELAHSNERLRNEISEREKIQQALSHLARHDSLTQLPNRGYFTEQLERAIHHASRRHHTLALLFMDLDGFKAINDTYGHEIGDKLLLEVSRRLRESVRGEDMVSRMGGDEFTVILNELRNTVDATQVARKIIAAVNDPVSVGNILCHVGISIGISYFPTNGGDADTLVRLADDAMYEAKRAGKNCLRLSLAETGEMGRRHSC